VGFRRCPATVTASGVWKSEYQITCGDWFLFRLGLRIVTDACYACAARDPFRDVLSEEQRHDNGFQRQGTGF